MSQQFNKRKLSSRSDERQYKRVKTISSLEVAKQKMHDIIEQSPDRDIDQQIYQLEHWNHDYSKTFRPFVVDTIENICKEYITNTDSHFNIAEYYFGHERCPLVFDIEWYNPIPTAHAKLFESISQFVDILLEFFSVAIVHDDGRMIGRNDVCVEQACTTDGRKASFHIKVPDLVFSNMACDMKSFIFYLCTWMYAHQAKLVNEGFPEIFFYQTQSAQKIIKAYTSSDADDVMQNVKSTCEQEWISGAQFQYTSSGIDTAIYSHGRAFRIAGVSKPNKPGEQPRFLRPCLVTEWWSNHLNREYLNECALSTPIPCEVYRREWARTSLLMFPTPLCVNIKVPLPQGAPWKLGRIDTEYKVLPATQSIEDPWRWTLKDIEHYIHPDTSQPMLVYSASTTNNTYQQLAQTDEDVDKKNGFIYIFDEENNSVRKFNKRDGQWQGVTDFRLNFKLDEMKNEAYNVYKYVFARYWNTMMNMRALAQRHCNESGFDGFPNEKKRQRQEIEEDEGDDCDNDDDDDDGENDTYDDGEGFVINDEEEEEDDESDYYHYDNDEDDDDFDGEEDIDLSPIPSPIPVPLPRTRARRSDVVEEEEEEDDDDDEGDDCDNDDDDEEEEEEGDNDTYDDGEGFVVNDEEGREEENDYHFHDDDDDDESDEDTDLSSLPSPPLWQEPPPLWQEQPPLQPAPPKDYEAEKQIAEYLCILHVDNITINKMFTASNVTIDQRFKVITRQGRVINLGDIHRKTIIFCPKHEMDRGPKVPSPSAFVGIDRAGRRFISCSKCGGPGMSIREKWWGDTATEMTWEDFQAHYGEARVRFIRKEYFKMKHLLRAGASDEDGDSEYEDTASQHSAYSLAHPPEGPIFYVGISPMGSGKTTMLRELTSTNLQYIMSILGFDVMHQPSILSISPRSGLAQFTASELGLVNYKNYESMQTEYRRRYGSRVENPSQNDLLCAQNRLSICLNSLRRLASRDQGYDIIIMDEFATMSLSIISKLMLPIVTETVVILEKLIKSSSVVILLAADGKPHMLKALLPFLDWDDPANLRVTVNEGGVGGVTDHDLYVSDDLIRVCQVLKKYILEGKSVYVPTNQKQFADKLEIFCKKYLGLSDEEVMLYHKDSPGQLKHEIVKDPETRLGFTDSSTYTKVKIFIATPAFGVGFSVKGDFFDITIAFFFTFPLTVPGNVQHLARIRGVKEKTIICYYQSRQSRKEIFKRKQDNGRYNLENAAKEYESLIESIGDNTNRFTDCQLRSFAIAREAQDRISEWYADGMFIDAVAKCTRTTPHLLTSWVCNKGAGPIIELPELDKVEKKILRGKTGTSIPDDDTTTPRTWSAMLDLWIKRAYGHDLSEEEVIYVEIFEELPIPYGRLDTSERKTSYVNVLDRLWRVMEVASYASESGARRLLELDYRKYVRSAGVALTYRAEREYQLYQLFEAWSRLMTPCIPLSHIQAHATSDAGVQLFTYLINIWRFSNVGGNIIFEINPPVDQITQAVHNIGDVLKTLRNDDAEVDSWIKSSSLAGLHASSGKIFVKIYAKIIRRGLRQLFGLSNVSVKLTRKGTLYVEIKCIKRLILLACVRRINIECQVITMFSIDKFSTLNKYHACVALQGLVPSDEDLRLACGVNL